MSSSASSSQNRVLQSIFDRYCSLTPQQLKERSQRIEEGQKSNLKVTFTSGEEGVHYRAVTSQLELDQEEEI